MIISGKNSIYEILNSDKTINKVMISNTLHDEYSKKIVEICKQKKIRFDFVDKKILDKISIHNQGYIAEVTDFKYSSLEEILEDKDGMNDFKTKEKLLVILDNIQDPHNFGSIIRVCECAGVDGIIIENRRSCQVNETVFKTSCGAINHIKIAKVTNINDTIKHLQKQNIWVYACEANGESIYSSNLKGNVAIVVGSEGERVGKLTKKICDGVLSLPMYGKVNSLNVSTATSAIVYEILRQRKV